MDEKIKVSPDTADNEDFIAFATDRLTALYRKRIEADLRALLAEDSAAPGFTIPPQDWTRAALVDDSAD